MLDGEPLHVERVKREATLERETRERKSHFMCPERGDFSLYGSEAVRGTDRPVAKSLIRGGARAGKSQEMLPEPTKLWYYLQIKL